LEFTGQIGDYDLVAATGQPIRQIHDLPLRATNTETRDDEEEFHDRVFSNW
jgi:hypothetical protein